jgi:hypothetical protein
MLPRSWFSDLKDLATRHALIGGFAVSVRTEPRFTQDIDVVIAVGSDDNAEDIVVHFRHGDIPC